MSVFQNTYLDPYTQLKGTTSQNIFNMEKASLRSSEILIDGLGKLSGKEKLYVYSPNLQ